MNNAVLLLAEDYEDIQVNATGQPECTNGPFFVIPFSDHVNEATSTLHDGFSIQLHGIDLCFCKGATRWFSGWYLPGMHVMMQIPSGSSNHLNREAAHVEGPYDRVNQARRVHHNSILNTPSCSFLYYLLNFGTDLNNDVFSPGTQNGKINAKVTPYYEKFTLTGKDGRTIEARTWRANLEWNIAIYEEVPRYIEQAEVVADDMEDQISEALTGMTF